MRSEDSRSPKRARHLLGRAQIEATADWIVAQQRSSGEIPWLRDSKGDPWDHIHSAMGLTVAGRHQQAEHAYKFLSRSQMRLGGWPSERVGGRVTNGTQESNHAAYFATGVWHHFCATTDRRFLTEMWPTLLRAIDFVCSLQEEDGTISWAVAPNGDAWRAPLLTGCSSIYGGLVCAERIADACGLAKPEWSVARQRLGAVLRGDLDIFTGRDLPEGIDRYSMDWYYPVLGGALRGDAGRERLLDQNFIDVFLSEGVGIRCVADRPWYTVAETCELVLALDASGLSERAAQILSWMHVFRTEDGGYWTGRTWPEDVFWPEELNAWTAATVLIAADALEGVSSTSGFFRSLHVDDEAAEVAQSSAVLFSA
ncbi:MAG: hypothetical protein ACI8TX_000543 [Hyphomicrobiaceae bacterium]|jgi:hypothetical protein